MAFETRLLEWDEKGWVIERAYTADDDECVVIKRTYSIHEIQSVCHANEI